MLAITRSFPPHCRQVSMSMASTRLRRCAHDIACRRLLTDTSPRAAEAAVRVRVTIFARSGLVGANTLWYLVKSARGFWHQRGEADNKVFGLKDHVRGAIAIRPLHSRRVENASRSV
jgi:hypothetical protein